MHRAGKLANRLPTMSSISLTGSFLAGDLAKVRASRVPAPPRPLAPARRAPSCYFLGGARSPRARGTPTSPPPLSSRSTVDAPIPPPSPHLPLPPFPQTARVAPRPAASSRRFHAIPPDPVAARSFAPRRRAAAAATPTPPPSAPAAAPSPRASSRSPGGAPPSPARAPRARSRRRRPSPPSPRRRVPGPRAPSPLPARAPPRSLSPPPLRRTPPRRRRRGRRSTASSARSTPTSARVPS